MSDVLPAQLLILGLVVGGLYGLLALGFVLVYKATRVVNLAHGDLGTTSALLMVFTASELGWGFWPSFAAALALGGVIGIATETLVIDKLRDAPRLVVLVATIGLAQLLVVVSRLVISPEMQGRVLISQQFPQPFSQTLTIGGATLRPTTLFALALVPAIAVALAVFFRYSRYGIAIRATADNDDNARLLGVSTRRVSLFVWALAGTLSAVSAVLFAGASGVALNLGFGPGLLVRALVPAVLARMSSMPRALIAGVAVGVVEQTLVFNIGNAAAVEAILLAAILLGLLFQRRLLGRLGELDRSSWPVGAETGRGAARDTHLGVQLRQSVVFAAVAFAFVLPFAVPVGQLYAVTNGIAFAIAGLSLTVLTGYGGQISLGQWALAGIGAFMAARVSDAWGWQPWAALLVAVVAGGLSAVIVGLPALRIRGLFLAVTTLAFAVAASAYLFRTSWLAGGRDGFEVVRPSFARTDQAYYFVAVSALAIALLVVRSASRGRVGRNIVAVRENEQAAAAYGVNVVATKLLTFAIAGSLAGLAGGIFLYAQQSISGESFGVGLSLQVVILAIVGGVGSPVGPIIGAAFLLVLPALVPGQELLAALTGGGILLAVLLRLPGGLVTLAYRVRDLLLGGSRVPSLRPPVAVPERSAA